MGDVWRSSHMKNLRGVAHNFSMRSYFFPKELRKWASWGGVTWETGNRVGTNGIMGWGLFCVQQVWTNVA